MMVHRSVVVLLVLVSLTECKDGAGKISSGDEVEMVRIPMISGYTKVPKSSSFPVTKSMFSDGLCAVHLIINIIVKFFL